MDGHAPNTPTAPIADDDVPEGQRPLPEDQVEPGYYEWLEEEIAAGLKDIEEGRTVPLEEVWKKRLGR